MKKFIHGFISSNIFHFRALRPVINVRFCIIEMRKKNYISYIDT